MIHDEDKLETSYFITHVLVEHPQKAIKNSLYKIRCQEKDLYPNEMPTLDQKKG